MQAKYLFDLVIGEFSFLGARSRLTQLKLALSSCSSTNSAAPDSLRGLCLKKKGSGGFSACFWLYLYAVTVIVVLATVMAELVAVAMVFAELRLVAAVVWLCDCVLVMMLFCC